MTRQELLQIAKPIIFNTPMVRSILDDRKTQTRRVIKLTKGSSTISDNAVFTGLKCGRFTFETDIDMWSIKPRYQSGDILYVRETWCNVNKPGVAPDYYYRADAIHPNIEDYNPSEWKWRPSIHMPKEAARIFLRVTGVRAGRVKNISIEDAVAEGAWGGGYPTLPFSLLHAKYTGCCNATASFAHLWDSIYANRDGGQYAWDKNPWVWVYGFEKVTVE